MSKNTKSINDLKDSRLLYEKKLPAFGYIIIMIITALIIFVVIWSIKTPKVYMVNSSGVVNSENKNYVMSPFTGKITEIFISEGSTVEEGDVLFTVESTELNLQAEQLNGQKAIYEKQISQNEKLVMSIKYDKNYFNQSNADDSLYYSQFESYKSQVNQNTFNVSTYKNFGYTDEQIQVELEKNQNKISEIYYNAIQSAEKSVLDAKSQLDGNVYVPFGQVHTNLSHH